MKIETKFNVGDTVYVCKNNSTKDRETCKICDGKGANFKSAICFDDMREFADEHGIICEKEVEE